MPYASLPRFIQKFGHETAVEVTNITDPENNAVDSDRFSAAQLAVDGLIDSHLKSGGYTIPLTTTPEMLEAMAVDLYYCELDRFAGDEAAQKRCSRHRETLKQIATGKLDLGLPSATPAPSTGGPSYSAPARVFTIDSLNGF